jgi:hypothetical protein
MQVIENRQIERGPDDESWANAEFSGVDEKLKRQ